MPKLNEVFQVKEGPDHDVEFDIAYDAIGDVTQQLCDMLQSGEIITIDPKGPGGGNPMVRIKIKSSSAKVKKFMADNGIDFLE